MTKNYCKQITVVAGPELDRGRGGHAAGILNKKIVVIGGTDWLGEPKIKVWLQDSSVRENGRWVKGPSLPYPLAYSIYAYGENGFYIAGGLNKSEPMDVCKLSSDEDIYVARKVYRLTVKLDGQFHSEELPILPVPLVAGAGCILNGIFYVVCGFDSNGLSSRLFALDTNSASAQWRECSPLPGEPRVFPAIVSSGSRLYILGGVASFNPLRCLSDIYVYDSLNDSWAYHADLPWRGYGWSASAVDDTHILLAGHADSKGVYSNVFLISLRDMSVCEVGSLISPATTAPLIKVDENQWWLVGGEPDFNKNRTRTISSIQLR